MCRKRTMRAIGSFRLPQGRLESLGWRGFTQPHMPRIGLSTRNFTKELWEMVKGATLDGGAWLLARASCDELPEPQGFAVQPIGRSESISPRGRARRACFLA